MQNLHKGGIPFSKSNVTVRGIEMTQSGDIKHLS